MYPAGGRHPDECNAERADIAEEAFRKTKEAAERQQATVGRYVQ